MIYDQSVRLLIRDMLAELAPEKGKVFTRGQAISWFAQHYPKIKEATVAAASSTPQTTTSKARGK